LALPHPLAVDCNHLDSRTSSTLVKYITSRCDCMSREDLAQRF
jgi:hypothetical protein